MFNEIQNLPWYKKLEILRIVRDLSQETAAEICGTTQKNWWLWENGKTYPRKISRKAIASAFGISVNEIFSENNNKSKKVI